MREHETSAPSLGELSEAATKGPWFADTEKSDGSYGSGEDTSEGYDTAVIMTEAETHYGKSGVLFESHNSTVGMIHEESDDESFRAWDAVSEANAAFIVALVNAFRAGRLIDPTAMAEAVASARAEGVREKLEHLTTIAAELREERNCGFWHQDRGRMFGDDDSMQGDSGHRDVCKCKADVKMIADRLATLIPGGSSDV